MSFDPAGAFFIGAMLLTGCINSRNKAPARSKDF